MSYIIPDGQVILITVRNGSDDQYIMDHKSEEEAREYVENIPFGWGLRDWIIIGLKEGKLAILGCKTRRGNWAPAQKDVQVARARIQELIPVYINWSTDTLRRTHAISTDALVQAAIHAVLEERGEAS